MTAREIIARAICLRSIRTAERTIILERDWKRAVDSAWHLASDEAAEYLLALDEAGWVVVPRVATDEMLRVQLAVDMPGTYRTYLRHPANGTQAAAENEERIAKAKRRWSAMVAASQEIDAKASTVGGEG